MTPSRLYGTARTRLAASAAILLTGLLSAPAYAAGSQMPWEAPLQKVLDSVEGPVAKIIAVIIIITTGLTLAFGDSSGGFRKLIQIIFGLSIAFAASSFFLSFFSFGGGALDLVNRAALPDGYEVPLHRSLTEPIMMGGAPRTVAISVGTLAAAVGIGLQLWIAGVALWVVGHMLAVWAARVEPQFPQVFARHIKHRGFLDA